MECEPETTLGLEMHRDLDALASSRNGWPAGALDHINEALSIIGQAIVDAPVTCERDAANKFRFAADLIDAEAGEMRLEGAAVHTALDGLEGLRQAQWAEIRRRARA
ncbi:hypothetical protein [Gellertiella hungarica]|uniref:Uncharacterized protein n=1 Tax=Gellertiella hungarica TaxID=1572859 RepID=A0A7W6J982_9HYPH|nr:hypothetical protein [Gellertiella hungarica]MBB4067111.1 hypothetical protein [Gellertiella hungarica]